MDDLFRESIAEIGFWFRTKIRERENYNGWFGKRVDCGSAQGESCLEARLHERWAYNFP